MRKLPKKCSEMLRKGRIELGVFAESKICARNAVSGYVQVYFTQKTQYKNIPEKFFRHYKQDFPRTELLKIMPLGTFYAYFSTKCRSPYLPVTPASSNFFTPFFFASISLYVDPPHAHGCDMVMQNIVHLLVAIWNYPPLVFIL